MQGLFWRFETVTSWLCTLGNIWEHVAVRQCACMWQLHLSPCRYGSYTWQLHLPPLRHGSCAWHVFEFLLVFSFIYFCLELHKAFTSVRLCCVQTFGFLIVFWLCMNAKVGIRLKRHGIGLRRWGGAGIIRGYSDSDFVGCKDGRKSLSGYIFTLSDCNKLRIKLASSGDTLHNWS